MRNFIDFVRQNFSTATPWLILGKGPTYSLKPSFDISNYETIALNHVVREMPVTMCHLVDIEVLDSCSEQIRNNARFLVMPWVPHVNMMAGQMSLPSWIERYEILEHLNSERRLLWYDLATSSITNSFHPAIEAKYFSSEAVLGLLGQSGVKTIRSLGIDGGTSYSAEFSDLFTQTRLANGQPSFDLQFSQFANLLNKYEFDYRPLHLEPIKIYIGGSEAEVLPSSVLEHSLKKHASMTIECHRLCKSKIEIPEPRQQSNQARTPFSFQRFLIPELSNDQGKAIYLDSDMLVLQDIRQLWQMDLAGADVLCINPAIPAQKDSQFSVMLMDCASLKWRISEIVKELDSGTYTYEALMHQMAAAKKVSARISPKWNFLDRYHEGSTALVHFTDMNRQPWVSRDNPAAALWVEYLHEAIKKASITMGDLKNQVAIGNIRPSLITQIERVKYNPADLNEQEIKLDWEFLPPHLRMKETKVARSGPNLLSQLKQKWLGTRRGQ